MGSRVTCTRALCCKRQSVVTSIFRTFRMALYSFCNRFMQALLAMCRSVRAVLGVWAWPVNAGKNSSVAPFD